MTDAGRIYWANNSGKISWASLDGSGGADLATTPTLPRGLTLAPEGNRVYWTTGGGFGWIGLDGSEGGTVAPAGRSSQPVGVAVDWGSQLLYWTDGPQNSIIGGTWCAGLSGATPQMLGQPFLQPVGLIALGADGTLTWAGLTAIMSRIGKRFTGFPTPGPAFGVAFDSDSVYWSNTSVNAIWRADLDGGQRTAVPVTSSKPAGIAFDPDTNRIYWANSTGGLSWATPDGSASGTVSPGGATVDRPCGIALLKAPLGGTPVIVGSGGLGQRLTCGPGTSPDAGSGGMVFRGPSSFDFQWLVDGRAISGETQPQIIPVAAGEYTCQVTYANIVGSATATSEPITVVTPV